MAINNRVDAVKALAKLKQDPVFLAAFARGDIEAVQAVKELAAARVGPEKGADGNDGWTRGAYTAEEMQVDHL